MPIDRSIALGMALGWGLTVLVPPPAFFRNHTIVSTGLGEGGATRAPCSSVHLRVCSFHINGTGSWPLLCSTCSQAKRAPSPSRNPQATR